MEEEEDGDQEDSDNYDTEYSHISKTLDTEMRHFISEFQKLVAKNDRRSELMMRRIRVKHPILHLITINAFKYLFENGKLLRPKAGQQIYQEYQPAKAHFYIVMYG